jgi:hypothetical protein
MIRPPIEEIKKAAFTAECEIGNYMRMLPNEVTELCEYVLTLENEITKLQGALKKLLDLLDAPDPVQVGCHCTDNGESPIICVWCKAKKALGME